VMEVALQMSDFQGLPPQFVGQGGRRSAEGSPVSAVQVLSLPRARLAAF
jgi:hypothetical protein